MRNKFANSLKELVDTFVKGEITDVQMKKKIEEQIKELIKGGAKYE